MICESSRLLAVVSSLKNATGLSYAPTCMATKPPLGIACQLSIFSCGSWTLLLVGAVSTSTGSDLGSSPGAAQDLPAKTGGPPALLSAVALLVANPALMRCGAGGHSAFLQRGGGVHSAFLRRGGGERGEGSNDAGERGGSCGCGVWRDACAHGCFGGMEAAPD